jgi:hypothetical protein
MSIITKGEGVRMYFDRPDITDSVKEMLSHASYKDIIFIVEDVLHHGHSLKIVRHRIKLGSGWMGKGYKINWIYDTWGLNGIDITIRMSKYTRRTSIGQCTIGTLKNRISLGDPITVIYGHERCPWISMEHYMMREYDIEQLNLNDERNEVNRIGSEMQMEQETEEVLWDKID